MNTAEVSNDYVSHFRVGTYEAQQDFKDVGAFQNPYSRHTPEWVGYHLIESKQFREDLDRSNYEY